MIAAQLLLVPLCVGATPFIKRDGKCEAYEPFQCPSGGCISLDYLCDNSPDCDDGYDENDKMCTAAKRIPAGEMEQWLKKFLDTHGPDALTGILSDAAANGLERFGGPKGTAIALSESKTADDFGSRFGLTSAEISSIKTAMIGLFRDQSGIPAQLNLKGSELANLQANIERLAETGFFDPY